MRAPPAILASWRFSGHVSLTVGFLSALVVTLGVQNPSLFFHSLQNASSERNEKVGGDSLFEKPTTIPEKSATQSTLGKKSFEQRAKLQSAPIEFANVAPAVGTQVTVFLELGKKRSVMLVPDSKVLFRHRHGAVLSVSLEEEGLISQARGLGAFWYRSLPSVSAAPLQPYKGEVLLSHLRALSLLPEVP